MVYSPNPYTRNPIKNEADIYFDFNDPIRTNQTQQITGRLKSNSTAVESPALGQDALLLFPQPAGDQLFLALKNGNWLEGSWTAFRMDGRFAGGGSVSGIRQPIALAGWKPGAYILVLRDKEQRLLARRRFIVQ